MKKGLLFILLAAASVCLPAQEKENAAKSYRVETNRFGANWFISGGVGAQMYFGDNDGKADFGKRLAPALDIAVGKWFTPGIGLRVAYNGLQAKGATPYANGPLVDGGQYSNGYYKEKWNVVNLHGDVLLNLTNMFCGYKEDRLYSFIPYVGAGFVHTGKGPGYDELGIKDKFFDIALNYPKLSDGSNYLMTWQGNVEYFWYHKDMFEKAGITETPQTLEDLLDVCQKLKDAGITPISAGNYDMIMRYPAFKAFRMEGNDFIDNARMGKEKFNSETGIATAQYAQNIAQYFSEGWTSSDATAQMDLFLNSGAAMLYTGTWDTPDLADDEEKLKDDISMFKLPVDSEGTATGENDYYANCGIGTAILKDSMSDMMKDFISYVWDNYADTAMYEFNMLPSMMPSDADKLPELTQQILSDLENCGTFAQCWDVRLDPSTNEVYRKELASLGMGESTPEEFCENMDKAVAQYASDYFDTEE